MLIILIPIIVLIIVFMVIKHKLIINKIKIFFKNYKLLLILELIVVMSLITINILDKTVIINEKDPHTNQLLKSSILKEGDTYIYYTMESIHDNSTSTSSSPTSNLDEILGKTKSFLNTREVANTIKIKNVKVNTVTVLINDAEKDYKYCSGFSYYGPTSCMCGTPIIFEKNMTNVLKIVEVSIIIIDSLIILFIKENKENIAKSGREE